MINYDLVVIGGGPAGLAAALEAKKNGLEEILILERDKYLGGILQQCIHNGFGLDYFKEELTGPEYADRFVRMVEENEIEYKTETMVVNITKYRKITALNQNDGVINIKAKSIILAMGCRERTRESILIPGSRPAGVFTAGTAQRYINIEGYMPGKKVIILGSGDIGLIMARRLTLEGAEVIAVLELLPYSSGLVRNKVQCLDDFDIPLKLNHTITRINGKGRVESVVVVEVDENLQPIKETEEEIACDTVLLSVGLIPENELSKNINVELDPVTGGPIIDEKRMTSAEGVFACGNVLQVHDLVDYVSMEAEIAGKAAADYVNQKYSSRDNIIELMAGKNIRYIVPHHIKYYEENQKFIKLYMRVKKPEEDVRIELVDDQGSMLMEYKKDIVTPGEMLSLVLPEKKLDDSMKGIEISLYKR
ncbi:MAG: NAD(P)/FAD-dependent oxidoreductase [Halanaerobiales bacterium]